MIDLDVLGGAPIIEVQADLGLEPEPEPAPIDTRAAFMRGVLDMQPGETVQDVLERVDPVAAEERKARVAATAGQAVARDAAGYAANLTATLIQRSL